MKKNNRPIIYGIVLFLFGFILYGRTLNFPFLYDDDSFIVLNHAIRNLKHPLKFFLPESLASQSDLAHDNYRPLVVFSYAINYHFGKLNPFGYRLFDIVLHVLNSLLVFLLSLRLLEKLKMENPGLGAFTSAAVFLAHPTQVETVVWVSQRSNIMAFLFSMSALWIHLRKGKASKTSLFLFTLALLCKEEAVVMPLFLWAWQIIERERPKNNFSPLRETLFAQSFPPIIPYLALIFAFVLARFELLGKLGQTHYWAGSFYFQVLTMTKALATYLRLMFWPHPLSLEYLFSVPRSCLDPAVILSALLSIGSLYCAFSLRRKVPAAFLGVLLFFIGLGPVSNIIPIKAIMAERFLYFSVMGFGLVMANAATLLASASLGLLIFVPLMLYAMLTFSRNGDWRNAKSLILATLKTCPQSARMHYGLGRVYAQEGKFKKAVREFQLALVIDPKYGAALSSMGKFDMQHGEIKRAISDYRKTLQVRVDAADALAGIGAAYLKMGNARKSASALKKAYLISIEKRAPGADIASSEILSNLALAYAESGRLHRAIVLSRQLLHQNPRMKKVRHNLKIYEKALLSKKQKTEVYHALSIFSRLRRFPEIAPRLDEADGIGYESAEIKFLSQSIPGVNEGSAYLPSIKKEKSSHPFPVPHFFLSKKYGVFALESGKEIEVLMRAQGARSAKGVEFNGLFVYPNSYHGTDVVNVPRPYGMETLYFLHRPLPHPLGWKVSGSAKIASFKLSKGRLEALSRGGKALFQLSPPKIFDSGGRSLFGQYELKKQKNSYFLTLRFDDARLQYPLLIDPTWSQANISLMNTARYQATATLLPDGRVLVAGGATYTSSTIIFSSAELYDPKTNTWTTTGSMTTPRYLHTATLLPNGTVLVAGGNNGSAGLSTCEIYNPATGNWSTTGSMSTARQHHTANLLQNGGVLVAGGSVSGSTFLSTAEIYDPASGTWTTTPIMNYIHDRAIAVTLQNGNVLVATGLTSSHGSLTSGAEIYNPTLNTWTTTGSMLTSLEYANATLLLNGQVLLDGGDHGASEESAAYLYNPSLGSWATTAPMSTVRTQDASTLLPNGKVLVTGGLNGTTDITTDEVYDPNAGTWSTVSPLTFGFAAHTATMLPNGSVLIAGSMDGNTSLAYSSTSIYVPIAGNWNSSGNMIAARTYHTATLLPNGEVLAAGGSNGTSALSSAELYNPSLGTWATTGNMTSARENHAAVLLSTGEVLAAGGSNGTSVLSSAELYNPSLGTWATTGNMSVARASMTATTLPNGDILVSGGSNGTSALSTAEIYNPSLGTWATTGNMTTARENHAAVLLTNGEVLAAGGSNGTSALSTAEIYNPSLGTWATTGSMSTTRENMTATLLPGGSVLVSGGSNGTSVLSTEEIYDPALGTWATTGSMTTARENQTTTLLPSGNLLAAGGDNGVSSLGTSEEALYTEYDFSLSTVAPALQPVILTVGGSSSFPVSISTGEFVTVTGSSFTSDGEGDGGGLNNVGSPTNYPRVYLRSLDDGNSSDNDNVETIDVSSSIYGAGEALNYSNGVSASSLTFQVPSTMTPGYYMLFVEADGVPSNSAIVQIPAPSAPAVCPFQNPPACSTVVNVEKNSPPAGCSVTTAIGSALSQLSTSVSGLECVVIRDTATYSEQVTVQGFTPSGYTGTLVQIMADPTFVSSQPVVDPPLNSTAAFEILNDSVTLLNVGVIPTSPTVYGVEASSPNITLSSVNVNDLGGYIGAAGVNLSSSDAVSYSFITVNSTAVVINGNLNQISYSSVTTNSSGMNAALLLNGASSNTVAQSYFNAPNGNNSGACVYLSTNSNFNTIKQSTIAEIGSGSTALPAIYLISSSSNNFINTFVNATSFDAIDFFGSNSNTISQSSITTQSGGGYDAVYLNNSSSNTIAQTYISNPNLGGNNALGLANNSNGNTISQSTMTTINGGYVAALFIINSSSNSITQSYITDPDPSNIGNAYPVDFEPGSQNNTISQSTMTTGSVDPAVYLHQSFAAQIFNSYIQGSTAVYISGSTGTTIGGSVIVATITTGSGIYMDNLGGMNLSLSSSSITGGAQGHGIWIDQGNSGNLTFSTNTISGGEWGVYLSTQNAGTQIWIASNTILPTLSASYDTYGIYTNGLTTGATIYNNGIYYRGPPTNISSNYSYGLYVTNSSGLYFHHNRINEPGMITGGSYVGAYFTGSTGDTFKFNDVNSTGTGLTNAYLMQLSASTVTIRDNIFLSSVTATSSATFTADVTSGFNSDYNDWFSSNSANSFVWGSQSANSLSAWQALVAPNDDDSISANPLWYNPSSGVEDFHPMSTVGRCYDPGGSVNIFSQACPLEQKDALESSSIDAGDPAEAYSLEPQPNGNKVNQGSYGDTTEASESSPGSSIAGCGKIYNVGKNGSYPYATISNAISDIPVSLSTSACVVIRDTATYSEQVTVQGFTPSGYTGTLVQIMADPTFVSSQPIVDPPINSTAAFQILNDSVTLLNIGVAPTNAVAYGVYVSSNYLVVSSITVNDNLRSITAAALYLQGSVRAEISYSSWTAMGGGVGLYLNTASSNVLSGNYAYTNGNDGADLFAGSNGNLIKNSTITAATAFSNYGIHINASYSNEISFSSITAYANTALQLDGVSSNNSIQNSVIISSSGGYGVYLSQSSSDTIAYSSITANDTANYYSGLFINSASSNTIMGSSIYSATSNGVELTAGSNDNIIQYSTMTSASGGYGAYIYQSSSNTVIGSVIIARDNSHNYAGVELAGSSSNTLTQSLIEAPRAADGIDTLGDSQDAVTLSSIAAGGYNGVYLGGSSSDTLDGNYIRAFPGTAIDINGSTDTILENSVVTATSVYAYGAQISGGSSNSSLLSNIVVGGAQGVGIRVSPNNFGAFFISTNTISGAEYGISITTQNAGTQIWISSNTILPILATTQNTIGIQLSNLTTGATIYNNGIYYRSSGTMGSNTSYGLYAQSTQGLNFHHNRINEPGMITGGSYVGAYFTGSTGDTFKFNDVNSTGTGLTNAYLMQLAASTVTIRDNIFLSSVTATSSATFTADVTSGFNSDYNDWFSSNSANSFVWGSISTNTLSGWQALVAGADAHSIASNPLWYNPSSGVEDFHPMSAGSGTNTGRCTGPAGDYFSTCSGWTQDSQTSPTIDAADPTETTTGPDGLGKEPAPNGCVPNQGSTGQTRQASTSVSFLAVSVSTNDYNFTPGGTSITMGVGVSTISVSSITVSNISNSTETYELSASTVTPGSIWTLTASTQPSAEHPVLEALFNAVQPHSSDFDVVTSSVDNTPQQCGASGGNYADGESGAGTLPTTSLGLWFKLLSPTASIYGGTTAATSTPQEIQVTVTAVPDGGVCSN